MEKSAVGNPDKQGQQRRCGAPIPGLQIDLELLNRLRFSTHLQQYQFTSDIDIVSNDNDDDLVSERVCLQGQTLTLPQRQQLPPPRRVPTSGRSRGLYPGRSAQTGLRPPPTAPQQQASGSAQEAQGADTGAGTGAGAVNDTRKSGRVRKPKRYNWSANGTLE